MSYILDALKKSEKERRRGKEQDDTSEYGSVVPEKKQRPVWQYFLGAALLLNASILLIWSGPWHTKETHVVPATDSRQMNEAQIGNMPSGLSENRGANSSIIDSSGTKKAKPVPDSMHLKEQSIKQANRGGKEETTRDIQQTPAIHNAPSESAHDGEIPPPDKNRLYNLNDLPSPVKQHLPDFSVSVFLYSDDPAARMVRINGQLLKEGQYLTEGVKLEEIIPDGLIFSYREYRFHLRLK